MRRPGRLPALLLALSLAGPAAAQPRPQAPDPAFTPAPLQLQLQLPAPTPLLQLPAPSLLQGQAQLPPQEAPLPGTPLPERPLQEAPPAAEPAPAQTPLPAPAPRRPAPRTALPLPPPQLPVPPPSPPPQPAAARPPLVAELSQSKVEITTGFSGTEVLVFGATERLLGEGGDDVLVVARSVVPEPMVVRRKTRVLGLWINGAAARFREVPGFYLLTGTRPLREMMEPEERRAKQLGLDYLPLAAAGNQDEEFRSALLQLKQSAGLWHEEDEPLRISGARLFRARLPLPATVGTGDYRVEVLLVRDGRVLARQELGFSVARVGTAARIADIADERPVIYGLLCILLAAFAGWMGSVLFRRG